MCLERRALNGVQHTETRRQQMQLGTQIKLTSYGSFQKVCQQQFGYCDVSTAVWLLWQEDSCKQSPNLSGCNGLDAKQTQNAQGHKLSFCRWSKDSSLGFWFPKNKSKWTWAFKSDDKATCRLYVRWRTKVTVNKERQPQLSWRVVDSHDGSVINGGSDVAN